MSYFSDASLVFIPSAQKSGKAYSVKPTDGTGDLTFSRSNDTATRVGPDGLIEKVRTNVLTYSEDLTNAAWRKDNITISSNAIANPLDGALTADGVISSAVNTYHSATRLSSVISGLVNISIYVKSAAKSNIEIEFTGGQASFNLSAGTINYASGGTATITSVGSGWYRCSVSTTLASASYVAFIIMPSTGTSEGFAGDGSTIDLYYYGAQIEAGDIATDYIATTSAAVSVGPVANVPRLDYLNSSCPRLLLEPQRTNSQRASEQINNASYWSTGGGSISANLSVSPDGYQNADEFVESAATERHELYSESLAFSGTSSVSIFAKNAGRRYFSAITGGDPSLGGATFDLQTGVVSATSGGTTASITPYGNDWYRCTFTTTRTNTSQVYFCLRTSGASPNVETYAGDGTSGILFWGCQIELAGAYATSYIPTLGAAVTRGADAASKTGISSLIGQTEGTIYWEGSGNATVGGADLWMAAISVDDTNVAVLLYYVASTGTVNAFIYNGTTSVILDAPMTLTQVNKVAVAYKNASFALYLNGALVDSSSSAIAPPTGMNQFAFVKWVGGANQDRGLVNQALLFPTRLSNADLAALTA